MSSNDRTEKSIFVIVLGPHRSGSSVTTKILESLGCNLGTNLLEGNPSSNTLGHFENLEVLGFHEELLKNLGTDWKNPIPFIGNAYFKNNRVEIENSVETLLKTLIKLNITAVKEPRMSILLDIWKEAFSKEVTNLKIVLTMRHPAEVALSLQKRDNLSHIIGVQLWVQATLNAIRYGRNYSNHFVFYDQLINEPGAVTLGISEFLQVSKESKKLSTLAAKDVNIEFRHNKVSFGESAVLNLANEMYDHILKFNSATLENFSDDLLDEWQKRIEFTYKEVNRLELIRVTDLQRDTAVEDLRGKSEAILATLTLERDEIAADRDRITHVLTSELNQNASEREQIALERDRIAADRDQISHKLTSERDQISGERDRIASERDQISLKLTSERDRIAGERDQISGERDRIAGERDQISGERDRIAGERDQVAADRDRIAGERDQISGECDRIAGERDQIAADRDRITQELTSERDQVAADRDRITSERDDLLNSTIWRAAKPIRWFANLFKR